MLCRVIRPVVAVPVLSIRIVSIRRVDSSTAGPRIRTPSCAPRPVPTSSAVGVARPSAQGQAMISTATAAANARPVSPAAIQKTSVAVEITITIGTKIAATRSARRWTGALPDCASVTRRPIWASAVSAPTRVARTISSPPPTFTVAPVTASPGCTSTGMLSPVSSARSIDDVPL